jgi:hypothetical protein
MLGQAAPAPATGTSTVTEEEPVKMSPFVVSASEDAGSYRATATLAGTRIRTELKDVGSAISVVTEQFLKDTGARNSQDLLVYTTSTEVGGIGGNFAGIGNGAYLDPTSAILKPQENTRVRGLDAADNTRDFFLTDIPWDAYIVGRVDLQRGPNSILYGLGRPAGIINSSINGAVFKNENTVEVRYGSFHSRRASADFNFVLLPDELAVRVAGLRDQTLYKQNPAYQHDSRVFAALRFDPKLLNKGDSHTSFRINYEHGDVKANRPRVTPPIDCITPWFTDLHKRVFNPTTVGISTLPEILTLTAAGDTGAGARQGYVNGVLSPNGSPWVGTFTRLFGNPIYTFDDPKTGTLAMGHMYQCTPSAYNALAPNGTRDGGIGGLPWLVEAGIIPYYQYASSAFLNNGAGLPNNTLGVYKAKTLTDPSIFDFYNLLIEGPNKREWQGWEAYNVALSQTFLNNRLGFEVVVDKQRYHEGQENMLTGYAQELTVDINSFMPDGSPNPNVGRPCVASDNQNSSRWNETFRDNFRFTAFGEFNFEDVMGKSNLTRILGRHMFTGLYSRERKDSRGRVYELYALDDAYGASINAADVGSNSRIPGVLSYLGPTLLNASTAAGANIRNIQAVQNPVSGLLEFYNDRYRLDPNTNQYTPTPSNVWAGNFITAGPSTQSENPANYGGFQTMYVPVWNATKGDVDKLTTQANLIRDQVTSKAAIWQGYLLDENFVVTLGLRKDQAKNWTQANPQKNANGSVNFLSPTYALPTDPSNVVEGSSNSWSFVLHTPKSIRAKLPGDTGLSLFYNRSKNFQPAAGRVDIEGYPIGAPSGKTKDYGFELSTLNDRLTLRVNWYETSVKDAGLTGFDVYMIPAGVSWGYMFARQNLARQGGAGGFGNGYGLGPGQTDVAAAQAAGDAASNYFLAHLPDDHFFTAWGIDRTQWSSWMGWTNIPGLTVTGDTLSKGTEYELSGQITKNWNINVNAAKTNATRLNMAGSFASFVEERWALYRDTIAGDVREWNGGYSPGETIRNKVERDFMSNYRLYRLQEGSDVPELRPWRFNVVTNYSFTEGALKGVNVGGAYRWQDSVVVGYPVISATAGHEATFDLSRPYKGPKDTAVDLWAGYEKKLTNKLSWRLQLNLRNIFASKKLIPITVQPDGSPGTSRIPEPFTWTLTNTFKF